MVRAACCCSRAALARPQADTPFPWPGAGGAPGAQHGRRRPAEHAGAQRRLRRAAGHSCRGPNQPAAGARVAGRSVGRRGGGSRREGRGSCGARERGRHLAQRRAGRAWGRRRAGWRQGHIGARALQQSLGWPLLAGRAPQPAVLLPTPLAVAPGSGEHLQRPAVVLTRATQQAAASGMPTNTRWCTQGHIAVDLQGRGGPAQCAERPSAAPVQKSCRCKKSGAAPLSLPGLTPCLLLRGCPVQPRGPCSPRVWRRAGCLKLYCECFAAGTLTAVSPRSVTLGSRIP